ncbi:unnamed protein product [Calypogeia fissa]
MHLKLSETLWQFPGGIQGRDSKFGSLRVSFYFDGSIMDQSTNRLQEGLTEVEFAAEQVLITRHEMVECDKARNSNREALTALRRQARTSRSSVPAKQTPERALITVIGEPTQPAPPVEEKCLTCGDHDGTSPTWVMCRSADVFVRLPFHSAHSYLEKEEKQLERRSRSLQSTLKEKTMAVSEKGGLSGRIPSSLLNAFVKLQDNR